MASNSAARAASILDTSDPVLDRVPVFCSDLDEYDCESDSWKEKILVLMVEAVLLLQTMEVEMAGLEQMICISPIVAVMLLFILPLD